MSKYFRLGGRTPKMTKPKNKPYTWEWMDYLVLGTRTSEFKIVAITSGSELLHKITTSGVWQKAHKLPSGGEINPLQCNERKSATRKATNLNNCSLQSGEWNRAGTSVALISCSLNSMRCTTSPVATLTIDSSIKLYYGLLQLLFVLRIRLEVAVVSGWMVVDCVWASFIEVLSSFGAPERFV